MFTFPELAALVDSRQLLRARAIAGRVELLAAHPNHVIGAAASLETEDRHQLELDTGLEGRCTCPAWRNSQRPKFCKHLAALALRWLEEPPNVAVGPWLAPVPNPRQRALSVLDAATSSSARVAALLLPPGAEATQGWFVDVPRAFGDAIDVRQTDFVDGEREHRIWTQGSNFSFNEGDLLYDAERSLIWAESLRRLTVVAQVLGARPAVSGRGRLARDPGSVTVDLKVPDDSRTRLVRHGVRTITQDEFVRFLIAGPPEGSDWLPA